MLNDCHDVEHTLAIGTRVLQYQIWWMGNRTAGALYLS